MKPNNQFKYINAQYIRSRKFVASTSRECKSHPHTCQLDFWCSCYSSTSCFSLSCVFRVFVIRFFIKRDCIYLINFWILSLWFVGEKKTKHGETSVRRYGLETSLDMETSWDTIHLNHLGPMPATNKNYNHIFAIDSFTKFVWFFSVKSTINTGTIDKLKWCCFYDALVSTVKTFLNFNNM